MEEKSILEKLTGAIIPEELRTDFKMKDIKEEEKEWVIKLTEKEDRTPRELEGKEVVLNGYMNPVNLSDHLFQGKPMIIKIYRRRWKEKGKKESYFNKYDLHIPGMKVTKSFGSFLKELGRREADKFRSYWKSD